jgi:hypothetical protein
VKGVGIGANIPCSIIDGTRPFGVGVTLPGQ